MYRRGVPPDIWNAHNHVWSYSTCSGNFPVSVARCRSVLCTLQYALPLTLLPILAVTVIQFLVQLLAFEGETCKPLKHATSLASARKHPDDMKGPEGYIVEAICTRRSSYNDAQPTHNVDAFSPTGCGPPLELLAQVPAQGLPTRRRLQEECPRRLMQLWVTLLQETPHLRCEESSMS